MFRLVMDDGRTTRRMGWLGEGAPAAGPVGAGSNTAPALSCGYDEAPVESVLELGELVRLRAELSWADWKAHPRFKKDRVLCDAQRRWGAGLDTAPWAAPFVAPANDIPPAWAPSPLPPELEAELAADEVFTACCDASFGLWMAALDADPSANDPHDDLLEDPMVLDDADSL